VKYWTLRIFGFVVGAATAVAFEFVLILALNALFRSHFIPRGPGWLFFPIAVGLSVSAAAPTFAVRIARGDFPIATKFRASSRGFRAVIVASILWVVCVAAYVYLFEPYGHYMSSEDDNHMLGVMLFPPVVALVGWALYTKLVAPPATPKTKSENVNEKL
jgi:hypothetical protein